MNEKQRAERILASLESVNEDLLAFVDDVGRSINFHDAASRAAANRFLDEYDQKLDSFRKASSAIASMIRKRQGIAPEEAPGNRAAVVTTPNDPIFAIRRPHSVDEEFTYTKPIGFTLQGQSFKNMSTWAELYVTLCQELARRQPLRFRALPDHPSFITAQGNRMFSRNPADHNTPRLIVDDIYAELKISANSIRDRMLKLLREFGVADTDMKVYLQREPEQDVVA